MIFLYKLILIFWYVLSPFFLCSPPNGCLQYHTGIDGRFTTFNWGSTPVVQHLRNQDYRICIRQEEGMNTDILKYSNIF